MLKSKSRTKKDFLRLHYKTLEGNRVVLSEKDAGSRILKILVQAGGDLLSNREIGEELLSNAFNLNTCLNFIHRVLINLQRKGLVEGSKLPRNSGAGPRYIWVWNITEAGKKRTRRYKWEGTG